MPQNDSDYRWQNPPSLIVAEDILIYLILARRYGGFWWLAPPASSPDAFLQAAEAVCPWGVGGIGKS